MSDAIVKADSSTVVDADAVYRVVERLRGSNMVPKYIKNEQDAFYILLAGAEMGLGPTASFRGLFSIHGQVGMKYQLVSARLRQFGWRIRWETESDDIERAVVVLSNSSGEEHRETYTIVQAKRAGLTSNDQWRKRPERMLRARAITGAADAVDGRVRMGLYSEDEVVEIRQADAPPVAAVEPESQASGEPAPEADIVEAEAACMAEQEQPQAPSTTDVVPMRGTDTRTMGELRTAEELREWLASGWDGAIIQRGKVEVVLVHADKIGVPRVEVQNWIGLEAAE